MVLPPSLPPDLAEDFFNLEDARSQSLLNDLPSCQAEDLLCHSDGVARLKRALWEDGSLGGGGEGESPTSSTTVCMRESRQQGAVGEGGREGASNDYKPTFLSAS